jgi:predicted PurR-regulated permease PerM
MSEQSAPRWLPRASLTVAVVLLGVLATLWVANRLRSLIFMVFISLFLAVALEPAVQYLAKRGWRRNHATMVVFGATFLAGAAFVAALVPLFVNQAAQLADQLPTYIAAVQDWLGQGDVDVDLIDQTITRQFDDLGRLLGQYGSQVAGGLFAVGNTVFGVVFRLVTVGLFAFYMVSDGPKLRRTVLAFMPQHRQREALRIWEIAVEKTGGYIYSRLILAVVAAAFTALVLTLLGVDYPLALGLWVGVLSQFVPVIGTYIAAVLPVVVAFFDRPLTALWVLLALIGYQQVENFLVAPRITAKAMSIHPAVSVAAVIAGVSLLGGIGAVLSLPVAATVQAFISTALNRHDLVESPLFDEPDQRRSRRDPRSEPEGEA